MKCLRLGLTKKFEAILIVVVSTGLAIFSADQFQRSGPDRELLRELREMHEARQVQDENRTHFRFTHGNAPPSHALPRVAQR